MQPNTSGPNSRYMQSFIEQQNVRIRSDTQ
jgi:hypothetical protein